jgi:site-specific recombinase XerC
VPEDTLLLIRELARLMPDQQIARLLNRAGKPSGRGNGWTKARVCSFRSHHGIAVYRESECKQRLAALRHLFDWLVDGQVVPINPAHTVRGPRHVVTSGQTQVLDPAEARTLLDTIDVSTHAGLGDRALIGLMVYSFARIGAALGMAVEDVFTQNRRLWVRLREKGGKRHAMPCNPRGISDRLSRW